MNEQNMGNLDVEAILANEELVKRLAAKVLDMIQQKPDAGVVCQGYYCNMAKGDQPEDWKAACRKKLDSLDMELEDGLAASVAEDYPLNAEELDQVITEIKTSEAYAGTLSRADMSRAVSKVLADNEIMRRKGSTESMRLSCTPSGPIDPCAVSAHFVDLCRPCGPNRSHAGSPWWNCSIVGPGRDCSNSGPIHCVVCSPDRPAFHSRCVVCSPNMSALHSECVPFGPGNVIDEPGNGCIAGPGIDPGVNPGIDTSPRMVNISVAEFTNMANKFVGELVNKAISAANRK